MKKRLEAELISIAHRILKLKNKSEVDQLYLETRKLYEALAVLKFYGDNYEQVKSEISKEELDGKVADLLEEKTSKVIEIKSEPVVETDAVEETPEEIIEEEKVEEEVLAEEETTEDVVEEPVVAEESEQEVVSDEETADEVVEEPVIVGEVVVEDDDEEVALEGEIVLDEKEESNEVEEPVVVEKEDEVPAIDFAPIFELSSDEEEEEVAPVVEDKKAEPRQISFEDFLGESYTEPVFVKPSELDNKFSESKPILNDLLSKGINIGLNDRVAFIKNLFGDSNEDFNRVLSQLNTLNSMDEANKFIDENVKPDYNNWTGKEEYIERFMELVQKKFS